MNLTSFVSPGLLEKILAAVSGRHPLAALGILLALALVAAVYRLLAEWQRRLTFDRVFTSAPGGSVIVQDKSKAGPAMWIRVGEGAPPTAPKPIIIVIDPRGTLPPRNQAGRDER